jgi:hypothetical protein
MNELKEWSLIAILWLVFILVAIGILVFLCVDSAERAQRWDDQREYEQAVSLRPSSRD